MKLYFVRHGQTVDNAAGIHQTAQTPLSELGEHQADLVGKRLGNLPIDRIVASDHLRTRQTSELINRYLEKPIELTPLLRERRRPTEFAGKYKDDPSLTEVKRLCDEHFADPDWHYSDEENYHDLIARAKKAWEYLDQVEGDHVVAVSHNAFIRLMILVMLLEDTLTPDLYRQLIDRMKMKNTAVTVVERKADGWHLVSWNDHSHLPA